MKRQAAGFTLLEVMVAVAILAVSLTAIFSAQAGAIHMAQRSRRLTTAALLARCKMGEIEEKVMREGLPAVSDEGSDRCCEDGEVDGFTCDFKVERIVLPEAAPTGDSSGGAGGGGALGSLLNNRPAGAPTDPSAANAGMMDAVMAGAMGGGDNLIAQATMSFVYPVLKPTMEEQIRRATVTVRWREGESQQSFDVTQFLVSEPRTQ